jgi:hypothetical protein
MRQTFKKKKFARQLHISEACRSGCKLHLERSPPCQCSPPPLATVEKQRMGSRWRKPGMPRTPKRGRPGFHCRRLTLPACARPGLLILVLANIGYLSANTYPIARRQAANSTVDSFHCLAPPISSDDHVIMSGYHS